MKPVLILFLCSVTALQGCAVYAVADAAVSVTAAVVKTGVAVAGAGVRAVVGSDSDDKDK